MGRKWWISGAARERCRIFIVMGKTDPQNPDRHRQQSMVLVPKDTPGVTIVRSLPVMGYLDNESHCEVLFEDVHVPVSNLLGEEGGGFALAQARLRTRTHPSLYALDRCRSACSGINVPACRHPHRIWQTTLRTGHGAGLGLLFPRSRLSKHAC